MVIDKRQQKKQKDIGQIDKWTNRQTDNKKDR